MFFKDYFLGIADALDAKFRGHRRKNANPTDTGELCELFIQDFLKDTLNDNFKIFRGGEIINSENEKSKQLDIVLCGKRTIKIFGDKGIYPIESVLGALSITADLSLSKLKDCMLEFNSIPKSNYHFTVEKHFGEEYKDLTLQAYEMLFPYNCVFAFDGDINKNWIEEIFDFVSIENIPPSLWPDLIVVNKKGFIELGRKQSTKGIHVDYNYVDFKAYDNYGICYAKLLNDLYNISYEESVLRPRYEYYFNKDI